MAQNGQPQYLTVSVRSDRALGGASQLNQYGVDRDFALQYIAPHCASRIYKFQAERFSVGQCVFGPGRDLQPNAANLPEVINTLQTDPHTFEELNRLLQVALPQVRRITVPPVSQ